MVEKLPPGAEVSLRASNKLSVEHSLAFFATDLHTKYKSLAGLDEQENAERGGEHNGHRMSQLL